MSKAFVKFSSYEGHALIEIWKESKGKEYKQLSFGVGKAQAILDCLDEITEFCGGKKVENPEKAIAEIRKEAEARDFKQAQSNDKSFATDDIPF